MNSVLDQLARSGLLPTELASEILAGKMPPIPEVTLPASGDRGDGRACDDGWRQDGYLD